MSFRIAVILVMLPAVLYGGCAALRVPEEPPTPSPMAPVWSDDELDDHLDFLNRNEAAMRTTGTAGYARAAAYVAARLRQFRLQPAIGDDFRVLYGASMNYPISGALRSVSGQDSTSFYPGIDFLPHGRSDSGAVSVHLLVVTEDTAGIASAPKRPFGVLFRDGEADGTTLRAWRDAGAVLAITVAPLRPRFYTDRVRRLIAIQLTAGAAGVLMPTYRSVSRPGEAFELQRRIVAHVHSNFLPNAGAVNLLALVAGKHPQRARDVVLVCADLDAIASYAGVETVDYRNFGVGTSALLEVARNLGFVSQRWHVPEKSVLMAVWSGSQLGHEGLREFLANPIWEVDRITSVIYVGLRSEEEPFVRRLLEERGLTLHVISPPVTPLFERPLVLLPDPSLRRLARGRLEDQTSMGDGDPFALPDMDAVVARAVEQAREMAATAYERLIIETTDLRPFLPASEDTLDVPSAAGVE